MITKLGGRKVFLILVGIVNLNVAFVLSEKMTPEMFVYGLVGLILGYVTGNVINKFSK